MTRKICITGGAGFIGTWVRKLLAKEAKGSVEILIIDSLHPIVHGKIPRIPVLESHEVFLPGDVRDRNIWKRVAEWSPDEIVHLAAETGTGQSMYYPSLHTDTNINGTAILVEEIQNWPETVRNKLRIILASSRAIYGEGEYDCSSCSFSGSIRPRSNTLLNARQFEPVCPHCASSIFPIGSRETAVPQPMSIYGSSKLFQEHLVTLLQQCTAGVSILRFQNVYGEGQSLKNPYTGILGIFTSLLSESKKVRIFEDGLESRDFVHVEDVAYIVRETILGKLAQKSNQPQIFNVGTGVATSVLQLALEIANLLSAKPELIEVTGEFRFGDIRHCFASLDLIKEKIPVFPIISLRAGLVRYVKWFLSLESKERLNLERFEESLNEMSRSGKLITNNTSPKDATL